MIGADDPKRRGGLHHAAAGEKPGAGEIVIGREARKFVPVVVDRVDLRVVRALEVVLELQIIGRVGEDEVDRGGRKLRELRDAIADQDAIEIGFEPVGCLEDERGARVGRPDTRNIHNAEPGYASTQLEPTLWILALHGKERVKEKVKIAKRFKEIFSRAGGFARFHRAEIRGCARPPKGARRGRRNSPYSRPRRRVCAGLMIFARRRQRLRGPSSTEGFVLDIEGKRDARKSRPRIFDMPASLARSSRPHSESTTPPASKKATSFAAFTPRFMPSGFVKSRRARHIGDAQRDRA